MIENPLAFTPALDERCAAQELQMAGGIRECEAGARRQLFDTPLALPEMFEQFEPVCMAQRLRDLREARENLLFRAGG